jgi:DNA polymerase
MGEREDVLADLRDRARYYATLTTLGLAPLVRPATSAVGPAGAAVKGQRDLRVDSPSEGPTDLEGIKAWIGDCQRCKLAPGRKTIVYGQGNPKAELMFVGEGPGADEDAQGEPFVGQAGKLLDNMLAAINLKRGENVYIANALKCRPPGNRNPEPEELAKCAPHLLRQIGLIRPRLIVALGRIAAQTLLNTDATIASLRGRVHRYAGVPLVVTYHPAYLLRNLPDKSKAWADLVFARKTMDSLRAA